MKEHLKRMHDNKSIFSGVLIILLKVFPNPCIIMEKENRHHSGCDQQ